MLDGPRGVAVNDRDEIAVTDCFSNRVSLFILMVPTYDLLVGRVRIMVSLISYGDRF